MSAFLGPKIVPPTRDPNCLHCVICYAIELWVTKQGPKDDAGTPILDMSLVIAKLSEAVGEFVHRAPNEEQKLQFEAYARECLEGAFKYQRTGASVPVDTGEPNPVRH